MSKQAEANHFCGEPQQLLATTCFKRLLSVPLPVPLPLPLPLPLPFQFNQIQSTGRIIKLQGCQRDRKWIFRGNPGRQKIR
ncbi:hypothetical protein B5S32_g2207 [[Candida] boidinii]|nr:hypothetical protein B5S32_g2207 [[Candida] boidinii]